MTLALIQTSTVISVVGTMVPKLVMTTDWPWPLKRRELSGGWQLGARGGGEEEKEGEDREEVFWVFHGGD